MDPVGQKPCKQKRDSSFDPEAFADGLLLAGNSAASEAGGGQLVPQTGDRAICLPDSEENGLYGKAEYEECDPDQPHLLCQLFGAVVRGQGFFVAPVKACTLNSSPEFCISIKNALKTNFTHLGVGG